MIDFLHKRHDGSLDELLPLLGDDRFVPSGPDFRRLADLLHSEPSVNEELVIALCRLPESDRLLRATFASGNGWGEDPFLGMRTISTPHGCPVPASARGWLECTLAFNIDLEADCGLYVGRVCDGRAPGDA